MKLFLYKIGPLENTYSVLHLCINKTVNRIVPYGELKYTRSSAYIYENTILKRRFLGYL